MGREHPVLLLRGQSAVEGHDLDSVAEAIGKGIARVADLALTREEDEDVPIGVARELVDRGRHCVDFVDVVVGAVSDLDGVGATRDLDDGRAAEVFAEPLGVERGRCHDDAEIRSLGEQPGEVAEKEVDVEGALVRLIDDDRVVLLEESVTADGGEQHAIGHDRDSGVLAGAIGEAHAVAHAFTKCDLHFLGESLGNCACGNAARLGVGDARGLISAECLEDHLGHLRGLARAGLSGNDDYLVVPERRDDVVASLRDRQVRGIVDAHARGVHHHRGTLGGAPSVGDDVP